MADRPPLPPALRDFVRGRLRSAGDVEVLLLLRRTRDRWWSAEEVAAELGVAMAPALDALERLAGQFLEVSVASSVGFRYAPTHPEREDLGGALATAWSERRDAVAAEIPRDPRQVMSDFAEAFRIRRRK